MDADASRSFLGDDAGLVQLRRPTGETLGLLGLRLEACEVAARRRDIGRRLRHRRLEEGRVDLGDTLTFLHH